MLQDVVDEATCIEAAKCWVIILGPIDLIQAIVVEDLDELGEQGPLIEHLLNSHLDMELARSFQTNLYSLPDTLHD